MMGRLVLASLALILLLNQSVEGGTDSGKNPSDDLFDRLIAYCGEDKDQDFCTAVIWDEVLQKWKDKFSPPSSNPTESQESQEMHMANWPKHGH